MRVLKLLFAVSTGLILLGCGAGHRLSVSAPVGPDVRLQAGSFFYLAKAEFSAVPPASGGEFRGDVSRAAASVLAAYGCRSIEAEKAETRLPSLESARAAGAKYLFIPTVTRTALRDGLFSAHPAALAEFYVSIFDVASGKHLAMRRVRLSTGNVEPNRRDEDLAAAMDAVFAPMFGK